MPVSYTHLDVYKRQDQGCIVETAAPRVLFNDPKHERTKLFLSKIISH